MTRSLFRKISSKPNPFVNQFRNFSGSIPNFGAHLETGCGRTAKFLSPTDERVFEMSKNLSEKKWKRQNAKVAGKKQP